jgi:hypothetical protein
MRSEGERYLSGVNSSIPRKVEPLTRLRLIITLLILSLNFLNILILILLFLLLQILLLLILRHLLNHPIEYKLNRSSLFFPLLPAFLKSLDQRQGHLTANPCIIRQLIILTA